MNKWTNNLKNHINTRQRIIGTVGKISDSKGDTAKVTFLSVFFPYIRIELEQIEVKIKRNFIEGKNLKIGDVCNFTADIGVDKRGKSYDLKSEKEVKPYISGVKYHAFTVDQEAYVKAKISHVSKYCLEEIKSFVIMAQQQPLIDNYIHEVGSLENVGNERETYVHDLFKQIKKIS